ncbi:unnamed protein product [Phaeothamnion confervicola]
MLVMDSMTLGDGVTEQRETLEGLQSMVPNDGTKLKRGTPDESADEVASSRPTMGCWRR